MLEKILTESVSILKNGYYILRNTGLSITSKEEWISLAQNVFTHSYHFFEGKKSKRWNNLRGDRNPVFLLHGYFQNDSALSGINLNMRDFLGGDESYSRKAYSKIMGYVGRLGNGRITLTKYSLVIDGLEEYLFKNKIPVDRPSHGFYRNLNEIVDESIYRAEKIIKKYNKKIDLIGHSLGGLVSIYAAIKRPDLFQRVIALAAPYRGTVMANIAYTLTGGLAGKSAEQMRTNSKFIKKLNNTEIPKEILVYSIGAEYDLLVLPPASTYIDDKPNIVNLTARGVGHLGIIGPKTYPLILNILNNNIERLDINYKKQKEINRWIKTYSKN